ncbi:MAG: ATP-binding protein [Pseudomonadota bacterium]
MHSDSTPPGTIRPQLAMLFAGISAIIFLYIDLNIELGVAAGVSYMLVVWFAYFSGRPSNIWLATVISTILILVGFLASPEGGEMWKVVANRLLAIIATWLTATLCLHNLRATTLYAELVAEKRVQVEREKLAAIVDSSHDAIYSRTFDGRLLSWNRGAETLFGYTHDEAIATPVSKFLTNETRAELVELDSVLKLGQRVENYETERLHQDGSKLELAISLSPLFDENRAVVGCSSIARDISAQKRWERALQELNIKLKRSNAALEQSNIELKQFAYIASHDLQAPLRHISGFVQLLQERYGDQLSDEAELWINNAVSGVTRMQQLIDDLLAYARVDSKASAFEDLNLEEIIERAWKVSVDDDRQATFNLANTPFLTVRGDRMQLVQLFQNLFGNALKYCQADVAEIVVSVDQGEEDMTVTVKDNGIGIKKEFQDRIFEIFRRLHTEKEYPGTGIGLAVCRRIVDRHSGTIWVESEPGQGSSFCFTLPFKDSEDESK